MNQNSFSISVSTPNFTNWADYTNNTTLSITNRGYTTHEHMPQYGLINMNGRLYDPTLARMLNADPFIADATSAQDFNRYSYVRNNPLKYTDPSGYTVNEVGPCFGFGNKKNRWKNFKHNFKDWWGGGSSVQLTASTFNEIVKMIDSGEIEIIRNDNTGKSFKDFPDYAIFEISTYGTKFENFIGDAYLIQDRRTGNYVGFFDTYNFDESPGRPTEANYKTTSVRWASYFSHTATPYIIYYWMP